MSEAYPFILTLHLFCAIFFVGFLFVDVCIVSFVKRKNPEFQGGLIESFAVKFMPFIVFFLFMSGGMLASSHVNPLNFLFLLKMTLAAVVLALVVFSLLFKFIIKKANPLARIIHHLVFIICIAVVFLAKIMNYFFIAF